MVAKPAKPAVLQLCSTRPLRLVNAVGTEIIVLAGTVWITACGVADDIFLEAGQRYRIDSRKLVLIEAIDGATIVLEVPPPAAWARWQHWRARCAGWTSSASARLPLTAARS